MCAASSKSRLKCAGSPKVKFARFGRSSRSLAYQAVSLARDHVSKDRSGHDVRSAPGTQGRWGCCTSPRARPPIFGCEPSSKRSQRLSGTTRARHSPSSCSLLGTGCRSRCRCTRTGRLRSSRGRHNPRTRRSSCCRCCSLHRRTHHRSGSSSLAGQRWSTSTRRRVRFLRPCRATCCPSATPRCRPDRTSTHHRSMASASWSNRRRHRYHPGRHRCSSAPSSCSHPAPTFRLNHLDHRRSASDERTCCHDQLPTTSSGRAMFLPQIHRRCRRRLVRDHRTPRPSERVRPLSRGRSGWGASSRRTRGAMRARQDQRHAGQCLSVP